MRGLLIGRSAVRFYVFKNSGIGDNNSHVGDTVAAASSNDNLSMNIDDQSAAEMTARTGTADQRTAVAPKSSEESAQLVYSLSLSVNASRDKLDQLKRVASSYSVVPLTTPGLHGNWIFSSVQSLNGL